MTQRMPRNQDLHERRHHRKAGAHTTRIGTRREAKDELRAALADLLINIDCPHARVRVRCALNLCEEER